MTDFVVWLRAQLDDDERVARAAEDSHWEYEGTSFGPRVVVGTDRDRDAWMRECDVAVWVCDDEADGCPEIAWGWAAEGEHIARWDPARVVAEVDAKRRILAAHPYQEYGAEWCGRCTGQEGHESWPCTTLRLLALPYAGRPGYRQEWRPASRR